MAVPQLGRECLDGVGVEVQFLEVGGDVLDARDSVLVQPQHVQVAELEQEGVHLADLLLVEDQLRVIFYNCFLVADEIREPVLLDLEVQLRVVLGPVNRLSTCPPYHKHTSFRSMFKSSSWISYSFSCFSGFFSISTSIRMSSRIFLQNTSAKVIAFSTDRIEIFVLFIDQFIIQKIEHLSH